VNVAPEAMKQALLNFGMPEWQAEGLVEDYAHYRRGEAAAISSTVGDITDKAAVPFSQFAKEYAGRFSEKAQVPREGNYRAG